MQRAILGLMILVGCSQQSLAADVFTATAIVDQQAATVGFSSAAAALDALSQRRLAGSVPYTGVEVTTSNIDFRGLPIALAFPDLGGSRLQLDIPGLGISRSFEGVTREESLELMKAFFKRGMDIGRIMKELARVSPVDPLAGNPNSLQSRLVAATFDRNFRSVVSKLTALSRRGQDAASADRGWQLASAGADVSLPERASAQTVLPGTSLGANAASYRQARLSSSSIVVPLSYALPTSPERPFSLDAELQFTDVQGATQYSLMFGGSYRLGMTDRWYLIPAVNYGVTGSTDLGAAGQMWAGSLTSAVQLHDSAGYSLWMGNGISYTKSLRTSIASYRFDPDLTNVAFVNGFVLSTPAPGLGARSWLEFSFSDTRFTGSDLYNRYYDEVGLALARSGSATGRASYWRLGLNYLKGSHTEGGMLSLQFNF